MAIPIRNYIDISTTLAGAIVGERDFSGLVFTADTMKASVPSAYASIKQKFDAGLPVSLSRDGFTACFDTDKSVSVFAGKYFGYSGGNMRPSVLNVCLVTTTAKAAYDTCINETVNFGAFTFVGDFSFGTGSDGGLLEVARANDGNDAMLQMVIAADDDNVVSYANSLKDLKMTHLVASTVIDESDSGDSGSGTNYGAWPLVAWYASVNYNGAGASGTIDYKQFSVDRAEVTTQEIKTAYDALNINYIGEVKTYGNVLRFYQTGVNMNGVDTGVMRDAAWIKGQIEVGYFNLQLSMPKIPADASGEALVSNLIVGVANRGINAGAILLEKPLDAQQISLVNAYANDDMAASNLQSVGYYVSTEIVKVSEKYHVQYTLIYGKGDHIVKVSGSHILV